MLMQHVMQVKGIDSATYVNTPCLVHHVEPIASDTDRNTNANTNLNTNDVGENVREWDEDFYLPLHDATNAGNVELSLWLLAHGADACAGNKDAWLEGLRGCDAQRKRALGCPVASRGLPKVAIHLWHKNDKVSIFLVSIELKST